MAQIEIPIANQVGALATMKVDADQNMIVPSDTDPSGFKRAGDLVAGDRVCHGRSAIFTVVAA